MSALCITADDVAPPLVTSHLPTSRSLLPPPILKQTRLHYLSLVPKSACSPGSAPSFARARFSRLPAPITCSFRNPPLFLFPCPVLPHYSFCSTQGEQPSTPRAQHASLCYRVHFSTPCSPIRLFRRRTPASCSSSLTCVTFLSPLLGNAFSAFFPLILLSQHLHEPE